MAKLTLSDEALRALFWVRAIELRTRGYFKRRPSDDILRKLVRIGVVDCWRPFRQATVHWHLTPFGKSFFNELVKYEEENPRYSAEEGPSALLHRGALFSWSHSAAICEIENMRLMRQRTEEQKAKASGRKGCAKTRYRAEPRPKVAICVDACRDRKVLS